MANSLKHFSFFYARLLHLKRRALPYSDIMFRFLKLMLKKKINSFSFKHYCVLFPFLYFRSFKVYSIIIIHYCFYMYVSYYFIFTVVQENEGETKFLSQHKSRWKFMHAHVYVDKVGGHKNLTINSNNNKVWRYSFMSEWMNWSQTHTLLTPMNYANIVELHVHVYMSYK